MRRTTWCDRALGALASPQWGPRRISSAISSEVTPFQIDAPDAELRNLRERLARTRWPGRSVSFVALVVVVGLAVAACGGGSKSSAVAFPAQKDCREYARETFDVTGTTFIEPHKNIERTAQFYDKAATMAPLGIRRDFTVEAKFMDDFAAAAKGVKIPSDSALDVITQRMEKTGALDPWLLVADKVAARRIHAWMRKTCHL
jgi:hypothetical protein